MKKKDFKEYLTHKNILLFIVFVLFFLTFRWNSFSAPFERDEGEYAYSAWILRQGVMPYENAFMQKPPMIIYTYAIGQVFDSKGVVSPRVLSSLFVFVATVLLGLIAKKEFGEKAGWITIFLVTPMLMLPYNTPFAANTENFMLLPLISLLAIYAFKRDKATHLHFFLSGAFASLALLYKPVALPIVLFIYVVWVWELYKGSEKVKSIISNLMLSVLGVVTTTLLAVLPFNLTKTTPALIESAFLYNLSYTGFEGFGIANIVNYIGGRYIKVYWPLYALVIYYLFKRPKRWWFYVGLFISSIIAVYSSPMGHYYILVMPFWALISAYAIILLSKETKVKGKLGNYAGVIITTLTILIIVFPFRTQFGLTPEELNVWVYGRVNPFVDAEIVASEVEKITDNDDYIFVAGSEPQIYFYSKRFSPTKYVITYPLNITSSYQEKYQKEIVDDLTNKQPNVIVVSNLQHSGLWSEGSPTIFIDYLTGLIEKEYEIHGIYVSSANKDYWLENFEEQDMENARMVVYKKID